MSHSTDDVEGPHGELVRRVVEKYVHRLFPAFRSPAYLACPDESTESAAIAAIATAASAKGVSTEVIDLRPAPAERLNGVTDRLHGFHGPASEGADPTLLVLTGFDLLEGEQNEAPTYPFRSQLQFDQEHLWLFVGRDWKRLRRLFNSYSLPLYSAASSCTPEEWRR